jgi:predicted porin
VNQFGGTDTTTAAAAAGGNVLYPTWTAPTGKAFKLNTASAKYDVNTQLSVAAFYQTASSDTIQGSSSAKTTLMYDRKTTGYSASYALTPVLTLRANYQKVTIGDETNAGTDGAKTTVTGLGADYAFSKRTSAYFRTERDLDNAGVRSLTNTGYTAATGNTRYQATAVGIRHTF